MCLATIVKTSVLALGLAVTSQAHAAYIITGGSATMTFDEGKAASVGFLDAVFGDSTARSGLIGTPAPGDVGYNRLSGTPGTVGSAGVEGIPGTPGQVEVIDFIRPYGETVAGGVPGDSRTRQETTLVIEDTSDVLGSWDASNDGMIFVGGSSLGEQIAFTNMMRWGGPFTGVLVYGDFALRTTPTGDLVLTSNLDFPHAAFATIAAPVIDVTGNTLTISGDLQMGWALAVLDPSAVPGTKFGTFSLTATLVDPDAPVTPETPAVPEPASAALLGVGAVALLMRRRR